MVTSIGRYDAISPGGHPGGGGPTSGIGFEAVPAGVGCRPCGTGGEADGETGNKGWQSGFHETFGFHMLVILAEFETSGGERGMTERRENHGDFRLKNLTANITANEYPMI